MWIFSDSAFKTSSGTFCQSTIIFLKPPGGGVGAVLQLQPFFFLVDAVVWFLSGWDCFFVLLFHNFFLFIVTVLVTGWEVFCFNKRIISRYNNRF